MVNPHMEVRGSAPQNQMSTNVTDDTADGVGFQSESDRYAELTISDEDFVIYDRENHQAWIQSSVAITADDLR